MKHTKNTITEPELFVDDHHGQYMGKIAWEQLAERYKVQAKIALSDEDIKCIEAGPDDEFHCDAMDNFTNVEFRTETGQKFFIQYAEGGMWVLSACFLRSKAASEFFGN
jgi:hypothetical protein